MQYIPNYTDTSAVVYLVDPRWDEQLKALGGRFSARLKVGPGYTFNRNRTDLTQLEALVTRANRVQPSLVPTGRAPSPSRAASPTRRPSPPRSRLPPPPPKSTASKRTPKATTKRLPPSPPKAVIPPIPSPSRKPTAAPISPRKVGPTSPDRRFGRTPNIMEMPGAPRGTQRAQPSLIPVPTQAPTSPDRRSLAPVPIPTQMSAGDRAQQGMNTYLASQMSACDRAQQALLNAHLGIQPSAAPAPTQVRAQPSLLPGATPAPRQEFKTILPFATAPNYPATYLPFATALPLPELGLPTAGTSLPVPQRLYTRSFHGPPPAGAAQRQQRASEDRYQLQELGTHALDGSFEPEFLYYAVFDGHGGSRMMGPAHVADYAVEHLHRELANALSSIDRSSVPEVEETIKRTFVAFDRTLHDLGKLYGTTATVVLRDLLRHRLYLANLGDSRSIVFNRNTGEIVAATVDHDADLESEKKRIEAGGGQVINVYGTARVNGMLMIARAFGDFELKIRTGVDYDPVEGLVSAVPDVMMIPDHPEYRLLLTSDAPYERGAYTDASLVQMIRNIPAATPQAAAERMVERIAPNTSDDITIVLG